MRNGGRSLKFGFKYQMNLKTQNNFETSFLKKLILEKFLKMNYFYDKFLKTIFQGQVWGQVKGEVEKTFCKIYLTQKTVSEIDLKFNFNFKFNLKFIYFLI